MLACLHITSRLNHELKSFHSNTTEIDYVNNKARKKHTFYHNILPVQPYLENYRTAQMSQIQYFHWFTDHPTTYKPRSNKTATKVTVLLCIILSGDIQLNPGPSKCNSCKKSLKSNSLTLTCYDCNKSVHIKCAGIYKHEFNSTYRNLDTWHCSDCSAPCPICHSDVFNNHKAIHCDHCQKWIHTQCCAIDDNEYKQLIHFSCSWACPDCNNFNLTNSFFEDSEIQTDNPFDPLNGNNHNSNYK